jgi:hypothetical protein
MNLPELKCYIKSAGGKRAFAYRMDITERYVEMLMDGKKQPGKRLAELIRLKIPLEATPSARAEEEIS